MKRLSIHSSFLALSLLVAKLTFGQSGQASQWVFYGPDGTLQYQTLANGDQIVDFSYAGYEGGGVALPVVPFAICVDPSGADDTASIQAALDQVSALTPDANGFRGAVLLTPGSFNVSSTLTISASGVVLRGSGSGSGGTILNMTGNPFLLLRITGSGSPKTVGSSAAMTDPYVPSGAISFNVDDASSFNPGDTILVLRPVTDAWVSFMGMDTLVRNGVPQTWIRSGTSIRTDRSIAAINGNQITLDAPLSDSFDGSLLNPPGGSIIKYTFPGRISQVGVEHLSVVAPAQDVDISQPQYQALSMSNVINGWVEDLAIQDTDNSIGIGGGTKQITVDNVSVAHSIPFTHSAGPADFSVSGTEILINQSSSTGNTGVWAFVSQAEVTGPVVLLNCSSDSRGFAPHQRWATGLLADSCQFPGGSPGIAYSDRGTDGSGQGWDAGWAVAWNVTSPKLLVQMPPGSANWCIGCVGTAISATEPGSGKHIPNGIYDSLGTPVDPPSLYLAQMCDRLGPQAVANIGYPGACPTSSSSISAIPSAQTGSARNR